MSKQDREIKFSIITASFNSEKTIAATFDSILAQIYPKLEYILIDGGSTDGTMDVVKSFEPKFESAGIDFKWISEKDQGIYDAWNKGLALATGDWVGFIGSDDIYYPKTFKRYNKFIRNNPDLDFISARTRMVSNGKTIRIMGEQWNWSTFKREMKVGHAGAIHNMNYFKTYGEFDTSYKITGDYELLLRSKSNLKFGFLKDFAAEMGGEGVSSTLIFETLREARRAKVESAGRNKIMAFLEMYYVYLKIRVKLFIKKIFPNAIQ